MQIRTSIFQFHTAFLIILSSTFFLHAQEKYFYTGKNYGSESLYNPLYFIINSGYDVTQLEEFSKDISSYPYKFASRQIFRQLSSPFGIISRYGWKKFLAHQVVPFNKLRQNSQWWPNYQLHLIGGGMEYARMKEWYEYYSIPMPALASGITMAAGHLLNEIVESGWHSGDDVDAIADIYVFDLGGIILFSFDPIKEYFSRTLNLADWSLQPSFSVVNGTLQNTGQFFSIKWKPESWEHWQIFYYFGLNGIVGPSYRFENNSSLSFGIGMRSKNREIIDTTRNQQTVNLTWNAGLFYDSNNSLLASLTVSGLNTNLISLNIYPGILSTETFATGFWIILDNRLNPSIGITTRYAPGLAVTSRK
jgi:hypothetical protein